jgi:hypothetical protein
MLKSIDVIIDISLKEKKKYNQNIARSSDDNVGCIRNYDEIFDFKFRGNWYTCAVLKCQSSSLDVFVKNGIEKCVFFFFY